MNFLYRICLIGALFCVFSSAYAENIETIKALVKLQVKTDSLSKRVAKQDSVLIEQADIIAAQQQKSLRHDSDLVDIIGTLHRQFGLPALSDEGFAIGVGATMVLQGTNAPNAVSSTAKRLADASFSTDLTFQKKFSHASSKAFLHCEAAGGKGLDNDLLIFSKVNFDAKAADALRVCEAWYEQTFIAQKLWATVGLMNPSLYFDCNVSANDETTQFLSYPFVSNPIIEYPSAAPGMFYTPGILLSAMPWTWLSLTIGVYDADHDWQRIGDNLFDMGEIELSPKILGWQGNYRFYGWYNQLPHASWSSPADSGQNSYGFGVSFDQECSELLTPFVRFGWRNSQVYLIGSSSGAADMSWSAGTQFNGKVWNRPADGAGLAIGQLLPSQDFKNANPQAQAKPETHIEFYYRIQCFDKMSIAPDFQYIINPSGADAPITANDIPVFGVRSQVDF